MPTLVKTADGSNTFYNEDIGEHYHSAHGALQESKHVFINAGLNYLIGEHTMNEIAIMEVGFGTGLNFLLSYAFAQQNQVHLNYHALEAFPLDRQHLELSGYKEFVPQAIWQNFIVNYENSFKKECMLDDLCTLKIIVNKLQEVNPQAKYDLMYYDAFSVRHQPEMWTDEIIGHATSFLKPGGIFVTYAITGKLKRALKKCGFTIEKLKGAPGKREMLRAIQSTDVNK